jgi:sterol desaturase/sphingolipid hydroxylase (fatty acid hydroxylase superfamily)
MPFIMGAGILICTTLIGRGMHPGASLVIATFVTFFAILGAERILPHRADWSTPDPQLKNDIGHMVVGTMLGGAIGSALTDAVFVSIAVAWTRSSGSSLWPSSWPFAVQVFLVYALADLGRYVQHRTLHAVPFLWRFHALHHSGDRLNVMKSSRSHITERVFAQIFMFAPLALLGAPTDALLWYIIPNSLLGLFAHSNVELDIGPVEYVFMGPRDHRIHHSAVIEESNSNYGSATTLWDIVFGTYTPPRKKSPERMGIDGDTMPRGFLGQLVAPFRSSGSSAGLEASTLEEAE